MSVPTTEPGSHVVVHHLQGERFAITARDHTFTTDQPLGDGGTDMAATPSEMFVGAFASCVALVAHRYLARHLLPDDGITVRAHYQLDGHPVRISQLAIDVELPDGLPERRRTELLAVVDDCTLHATLLHAPIVRFSLDRGTNAPVQSLAGR